MFPLIVRCAEKLQVAASEVIAGGGIVDAYDMMARYSMECICSSGFGLDTDIMSERNSQFMTLDLLMELEALGTMKGESFERKNADGTPVEIELEMDAEVLAAQVYVFFAAGYSTSAIAASTTLHYLALYPDVQQRIQKHIDEILAKHDDKITYDSISEMSLLDMALKESMRLFPPTTAFSRICTKQYTFPGTNITIDPGVRVVIPTQAVYTDEKYFDNPTEYRPERFLAEEVNKRPKYAYLPFCEGQRKCIGARLGTFQSMAGVAAILQKFNVVPAPTSKKELKINRNIHHVQIVDGGLPVKLIARTDRAKNM
ncbi:unnamed protein product [Colias eurytheme]|nr:unnamed protein product [Colias eurytheme]